MSDHNSNEWGLEKRFKPVRCVLADSFGLALVVARFARKAPRFGFEKFSQFFDQVVGCELLPIPVQRLLLARENVPLSRITLSRFARDGDLLLLQSRLLSRLSHRNAGVTLRIAAWISIYTRTETDFPDLMVSSLRSVGLPVSGIRDCSSDCARPMHAIGRFDVAESVETACKKLLDQALGRKPGLRSETSHFSAIGHMALLDYLTKAIVLRYVDAFAVDITYGAYSPANARYADLWLKALKELGIKVTSPSCQMAEPDMELWPASTGQYMVARLQYGFVESRWVAQARKPLLHLPDDVSDIAIAALQEAGFDRETWFVGLHLRSGVQRERVLRNTEPEKCGAAIDLLTKAGGQVIVVGDFQGEFAVHQPESVIDTRFLAVPSDIREAVHLFVWARARFFIGNLSGGTFPPGTFGTPTLWVDVHPTSHFRPPSPNDLVVPKLIHSIELNRFLSIRETQSLEHSYAQAESPDLVAAAGYDIRGATPTELALAVQDMQTKTSDTPPARNRIDDAVDAAFTSRHLNYGARIAPSFLTTWGTTLLRENP